MAMTPSAKKKLAFLGIALGALAIDRGLVFSGGSDANAEALLSGENAAQSSNQPKKSSAERSTPIADQLEEYRDMVSSDDAERDAFRLPEALSPEVEVPLELTDLDAQQDAQTEPQPEPLPSFEVSAIIANSSGTKMAVINGTPIRIGETKQGITLLSVSSRTATIRYDGRTVDVVLNQ